MAWRSMDTAPKGSYQELPHPKGVRQIHVPENIILALAEGDQVVRSYWIDEEGRWAFTSKKKNTPIAWQPWPAHPNKEQA